MSSDPVFQSLLQESRAGRDIFDIPMINNRVQQHQGRTLQSVRDELLSVAADSKQSHIPMLTPDEIVQQYNTILDNKLTIWDDQPTSALIEEMHGPTSNKLIFHNQDMFDVIGHRLKKFMHAAPVTHTRSQRNFLQDYTHLRSPLRRYLLSHSVHYMNESIIDFAERGGYSCFNRCMKDPGRPINEEEKRCVHFCGEALADVRKILVTDWLNLSENLDGDRVPTLPTGNEMGDKETGTFNSHNRESRWNQYQRQWGGDTHFMNHE